MKWISIRNKEGEFLEKNLPLDKKNYLFIQWHKDWQTVIVSYIGTMDSVNAHRRFHLKNYYTHFCLFEYPEII